MTQSAIIDSNGKLVVVRSGHLVNQTCPFSDNHCGIFCPLFVLWGDYVRLACAPSDAEYEIEADEYAEDKINVKARKKARGDGR